MLDDPNMPGWLPGAPAPWLDAYGPTPAALPPIDQQLVSTLGPRGTESTIDPIPTPPPPPQAPVGAGTGRKGGEASKPSRIGEGGPQAQEEIANTSFAAAQPSAESGGGSAPPWLADMQQHAQVAGGPAPFSPPWLQAAEARQTPDAVSGAAAPPADAKSPDQALALIAVDPNAALEDRQKAWRDMAPEQRTLLVNNADPKQLAAIATADMDSTDLAAIAIRHQQAQIHEQSAQQLELARRRDEDAARDYATYQGAVQQANAKTAQLMQDAQNLAQQKIDPNEHGVGHFIASVLTSAIGGAMSQYTGGRNLALEELDKKSQQRIEAQQANITNGLQAIGFKRNLIAEQLQQSGDLYHASTAYHVSQYDRALADLQTRMQDYDPQGTTSLRLAGVAQQVQAQRIATLQAHRQQLLKNFDDLSKTVGESAASQVVFGIKGPAGKTDADIAKARAETDKLRGAMAGAGATKPEDVKFPVAQWVQMHPDLAKILPPDVTALSQNELNRFLDQRKKVEETAGSASTADKGATEAAGTLNAGLVRNPVTKQPLADPSDKTKQLIYPVTQATEFNDQIGATQAAIDNLSAARRALAADPSTFDRKEWARIQSKINQSFPQLAKVYGEKYSARTEEALKDLLHLDYDSYIARVKDRGTGIATIDSTIDSLVENGNTTIGTKLGYDADKNPLFLDTSRPPESPRTATDKAVETLASPSAEKWTDEDHAIQKMREQGGNPATVGRVLQDYGIDVRDPQFKADLERVKATNVPISKIKTLDSLREQAVHGTPDEQKKATAAITEIANSDGGPLGDLAKSVAVSILSEQVGADLDSEATK